MKWYKLAPRPYFILLSLQVALTGWGCATTPPYTKNPFLINKEEIKAKITTVVLEPLSVPDGLENPEQVVAQFEPLITKKLFDIGFSVIDSKQFTEIWKWSTEQVGGLFDPTTGKKDESKFVTARRLCIQEVRTKYHADALVSPSIQFARARFANCVARWDGAEEEIYPRLGIFCGTGDTSGEVSALSLVIRIENMDGSAVYLNGGGIQVLSRMESGFLSVLGHREFAKVERGLLFANQERNQAAVNIALNPLLR